MDTTETINQILNGLKSSSREYKVISDHAEDLKERVRHLLIPDNYDEWDKLLETLQLQHEMELEAVYKQGIRQGAFVQKVICCEDCISHTEPKADIT